jgi:cell shape-determining protein MreC
MKYKKHQNICLIVIIICFALFIFHFFNELNFLPDIIVMGISFALMGVFSFLNSAQDDLERKDRVKTKEDELKEQALKNVEEEIIRNGKQNTITYLEKNNMLEAEMEKLRCEQK